MKINTILVFISIFYFYISELKANCPIIGPNMVCQDSKDVVYKASMGGNSFSWSIELGDAIITGSSNLESVTIAVGKVDFILKLVDGNDSCIVNVKVNQKPIGSAPSIAICSGSATNIVLTSSIPNTTFTWTASHQAGATITGFSSCTSACSTTIVQTLINLTNNNAGVVRYIITPTSSDGCVGNTFTVDVTVNPKPVGSASPETICSGATTSVSLSSTAAGTTFIWTAAQQSGATITGFSNCATACGTTIAQILTNTTNTTAGVVRYTVTPTSADGCFGNTFTVDVTVNPKPTGSATNQSICSGFTSSVSLSSTIASTTFTWTATQLSGSTITGFSNCAAACGTTIAQNLTNTSNATPGVVRYTVTPTSPNGCVGNTFTVDVTVNPKPSGSASTSPICSGSTTNLILTSSIPNTTYTWTAAQQSGAIITGFENCPAVCGTTIAQTLRNTTNDNPGVVRYTITPTSADGCVGNTFTVDVTVKSLPNAKIIITPSGNRKRIINDNSSQVAGIVKRTLLICKDGTTIRELTQPNPFINYILDSLVFGSLYKVCLTIEDLNGCSDIVCNEFTPNAADCNGVLNIILDPNLQNRCIGSELQFSIAIRSSNKFIDDPDPAKSSVNIKLYVNNSLVDSFMQNRASIDESFVFNRINDKCELLKIHIEAKGSIGGGAMDVCTTDTSIRINCLPIKELLMDSFCFNPSTPSVAIKYKFQDTDSNNILKVNPFSLGYKGNAPVLSAEMYLYNFDINNTFNNLKNIGIIHWDSIQNNYTKCQLRNQTDTINLFLTPKLRKIDTTACQGTKLSIPLGYILNKDLDFKWKSTSAAQWDDNKLIEIKQVLIGPNTYQYRILNKLSGSLMCGDSSNFTVTGRESPEVKIVEIDKCIGFYKAEITNQSQPDKIDWLPNGDDPRIDSIKRDLIRIIPNKGLPDSLCITAKLGTCSNKDCIPIDQDLIGDTTVALLSKIDCKDSTLIFTKQNGCYRWISINNQDNNWEVIDSKNAYIVRDSNYIKEHLIVLRTFPCDDPSSCGNYELFIRSQNTGSDCHEHNNGSINFFPNPTADILTLSFENLLNGLYSVKIYNAIGNRVYDNALFIDNHNLINKINLNENLPAGIYHILIENNFGNYWLKNIAVIR